MRSIIHKALVKAAAKGWLGWMPDKPYLECLFWGRMGRRLDLRAHPSYNEVLQWIKLYDRDPRYTAAVDKLEVKRLVGEMIGEEYIIPTLGVWDAFDEIDFDALPDAFVLKCTHDSGGLIVCGDKTKLNLRQARKKMEASLRTDYSRWGREWPYKHVKPRILAEQMISEKGAAPVDYKFFCFQGEIDSVMLCMGRELGHPQFVFYDMNWNRLMYQKNEPVLECEIRRPENFDEMVSVAKRIAQAFDCPRIDLYHVDGRVYFGEITFFNQSGFDTDITLETDLRWGEKANRNPKFRPDIR